MAFKYPQYLVETDWLAEHLNDSDIRVLDCTAFNRPDGSGGVRADSGHDSWAKEHITRLWTRGLGQRPLPQEFFFPVHDAPG